ncbi:MAG: hypothetical protein ABI700_23540 [Chloroflexota bacterium]
MPVDIEWFLENRVVLVYFRGVISLEEIVVAANMTMEYVEKCEAPLLHTLHDASELKQLPHNLKAIRDATQDGFKQPKVGWIVAYDVHDKLIGFLGNMTMQLFRVRYRVVNTQLDAIDFLNAVDSTLPPLRPIAEQRVRDKQRP